MGPAPLQVNQLFTGEVSLSPAKQPANADGITVSTTPNYRRNDVDPVQWLVTLEIVFGGADGKISAYSGRIEMIGHFSVAKDFPADRVNKAVAVTCATMLYSAAREMIATITGRGPHGVFLLPSVSFADHDLEIPAPAKAEG